MTLLNSGAMFAAAAVLVPILIHLQKRRKSKVVDWPAMQFLKRTVTSRRRGLTLEHLVLLLLRCLLVLLFVFAMARPVVESGLYLSKVLFFLLVGCGLLLLTAAIVSNWRLQKRLVGIVVATLLFGGAGSMLSAEPETVVDSKTECDIAIVIDSSLTMTLGGDETSHFDRAISQAQSLVETLSGNSTVSIVMAGPVAKSVDGSPFRNLRTAEQVLGTLAPMAGGSDFESAIRTAESLLKRAPNTRKQVLLLTDDQLCTWESIDEMKLADRSFAKNPAASVTHREAGMTKEIEGDGIDQSGRDSAPEIACNAIVAILPEKTENVSVDRVEVRASLVSAGRPIPIEVEVRNGGSTTIQDVAVNLLVDGKEVASESLIQIEPSVSSTVRFMHAFSQAGQHVVSGTVQLSDQLTDDNRQDLVVDVIPHLSILLVNGSTDVDSTQQSATFAQIALDAESLRSSQIGGQLNDAVERKADRPIIASTIEATRLNEFESLENFQLIMLCDVPRLPADAAERVAKFVADGGGLWVIPGEQTDVSFYNNWRGLSKERIIPVDFGERDRPVGNVDGDTSRLAVALDVAGRPFISDLFERGNHDLADISINQFWRTTPLESAIVGMRLTNGEPLFIEQAFGRGRVLMQNVSLSQRDSNFPANLGFPVLMHLWTYHLAASNRRNFNFEPTSDLVTELATRIDSNEKIEMLRLVEPDGAERDIPISWEDHSPIARIGNAIVPGVYQLRDNQTEALVSSFAIHRASEESDLSVASEDRLKEITHGLGIELIDDVNQWASPVAGESPATEIWQPLLFIVLWLLAAECLVTKWIRIRRGMASTETSLPSNSSTLSSAAPLVNVADRQDRWSNALADDSLVVSGGASR